MATQQVNEPALQFDAFDATPGEKYRAWRQHLFSHAATRTDESGSSLADALTDSDMGGAAMGAPAYPAAGAQREKMQRLRSARAKASYALIYRHISDGDLRTILYSQHFQDGFGALTYLDTAYDTPITRSELRAMDVLWTELSIALDVGVQPDSISRFAKLLQRVNSQRPAANRFNNDELCEKLLEAIADSSRHFHENAMREYDAPAGSRQFEYPAAHPLFAGQRDFGACSQYYDNQWKQAYKAKILTPSGPLRRGAGGNMRAVDAARAVAPPRARSTSPTASLQALAASDADLPPHTTTTTDFHSVAPDALAHALVDGGAGEHGDGFDVLQCYDADGVPSAELICDNCRGVGHPRRLCPSPRRFRTFDYAIGLLQAARDNADARARREGRPRGGRHPPPRGQRPPFRPRARPAQPHRFQAPRDAARLAEAPAADVAHESAHSAGMPLLFDDESYFAPPSGEFAQEGGSSATADVGSLARVVEPAGAAARLAAALLAALRGVRSLLSLRGAVFAMLALLVGVCWASPDGQTTEHLGLILGQASLSGATACVDSGATVTCLSEELAYGGTVCFRVTNRRPRRRLRVASNQLLEITAIGELTFPHVTGFTVKDGKRVTSTGAAKFHEVAVVRGLAPDIILLSVRSLKRHDGILVYFNDDNADKVEDCLRLPDGVYVPFVPSTHDIAIPLSNGADSTALEVRAAPWDVSLRIHAALCHAGATRVQMSDVTYNGRPLPRMPAPHVCVGCRLGGSRAPPSYRGRVRARAPGLDRGPVDHYGQLIYSDCCTGFPPSFPHGFTGMVNFCDAYSGDRDRRFLTRVDSTQVYGALSEFRDTNRHRLKDGKIGVWQTDNGNEFRGECLTDAVDDLLDSHDYTVPNNKNANAVAERDWGVIERGMRACLAYADDAPACLWPWAAFQCSNVYHYLATTTHQPPVSAHSFLHPGSGSVDMTWARVLFCDVTVALPERDVRGKLWHRAAEGCHLAYDPRRRAHIVYCPRYRRLGTFTVTDWCGENRFTICKLISSDTPVEYHTPEDLPMSPATSSLLPGHFRASRDIRALGTGTASELEARRMELAAERALERDPLAHLAGAVDSELQAADNSQVGCEITCGAEEAEEVTPAAEATKMPPLPTTIEEARRSPFWPLVKDAMEAEIRGKFIDNRAWEVVPRTANMHVIRSKWVIKWILNKDGSVKGVKARMVACGYSQIEGKEYTSVYARTLAAPCFRLFCSIVADEDLETDHVDAYKAFTQSDVDCELYVEMPYGFAKPGYVLKLNKALEGIKQGAHLWMEHNKTVLLDLGFKRSMCEASLYSHGELNIIVAVFADDIAAGYAASVATQYASIKDAYMQRIRVRTSEITPLSMFVGVAVQRDRSRRTLTISQSHYIDQLASRYAGKYVKRNTPGPTSAAGRREFERMTVNTDDTAATAVDRVEYLKLIGGLIWPASMTRPDVAYYVSFLAGFNAGPTQEHRDAALAVLGYLVQTRELGITYGGSLKVPLGLREYPPGFIESRGLHTYHDSSWGTAPRPYGGYVVLRANGAVSASARALKIVPESTAEAETAVASKAAKETVAMRSVSEDVGRCVNGATVLFGDNKAAYDIIVKAGLTARTRYFERATLGVKRLYMLLAIVPYLVPTKYMVADILTKCTDKDTFYRMRDYMLNLENGGYEREQNGLAASVWAVIRRRLKPW